ncbi:hypothetical protein DYB30_008743 [Aphanomyces astaci]|uniref:DNA 3'-5' helicase n=1 Tax=Aphanomyces astaci TaxID=112090 RepID=A0A397DTR4_APHAT|nr:hypothetical protein DYB38_008089 [Aphanomyces astaci]RHY37129.1 hypothetical protein DYB34_005200 [Aphanomyces astaci]RHY71124.1 hypothetical protein DYB30_008743 [Aphanomyces astaci]RHZ40284.1 hypothetical protein DYB31_011074 [Aphanomyces astaci]
MVRHLAKWDAPTFPWSTVALKVLHALSPSSQSFRPCQEAAVNLAQSGFSLFLQLPTGAGKSVCFQLPSLLQQRLNKVTLVVSPLRSLLADQKQHLTRLGLAHRAIFLSPGNVPGPNASLSNDIALVYATPELLLQNSSAVRLLADLAASDRLARVVLDEAHCVLEWGNSFRPTYLEFAKHCRQRLPHLPVTFVTATASPEIVSSTANLFGLQLAPLPDTHTDRHPIGDTNASTLVVLQHMLDRPNLRLQVLPKTKSVLANMASLLKAREPAIVYVLSQKDAEAVAAGLMAFGIQAQPYHAGLSDPARKRAQQLWTSGKISVICATVAFGVKLYLMGIDRADVRHVIHHSLPMSLSAYMQQIVRRDGLPATCTLFYAGGDRGRAAFVMSGGDGFLDASASHGMRDVVEMVTSMDCRRRILHSHFGNDMATLSDEEGCCRNCNCGESVVDEDEEATRSERRAAMTAKRPSKNLDVEWLYQSLDKSADATFLRFAARFCGVKTSSAAHGEIRLKVGNVLLHQPNTIVRHFARAADRELELTGQNALEQAEIAHYMDVATTLRGTDPINPVVHWEALDKALASKVYFVGNRPTLADATLFWSVHAAFQQSNARLAPFVNLRRWFNQIQHTVGVRGFPDVDVVAIPVPTHVLLV